MARYHVTVEALPAERSAEEAALAAGAEVIRKAAPGAGAVTALADDAQIAALTEAGCVVHRHEDLAEGAAGRLAEVGRGDRYAEALRRLAGQ
ncbi:MAG TPA: hypothetical protein VM367_12875 [Pseudonocardia sp.]|jgi:hypothetical protein|nr:hypothetical protein [Pseudonocardia sp.]